MATLVRFKMASVTANQDAFSGLSAKFSQLLHGRSEGDKVITNKILDELNAIDYRYPVVTNNTRAVLLVNQFGNIVAPDDTVLVAKCCSIIANLVNKQQVAIEGRTLLVTIEWILQAIKCHKTGRLEDILVALDALLRSNTNTLPELLCTIVAPNGPLLKLLNDNCKSEITLLAVQCLEACCGVPENYKDNEKLHPQYELCVQMFLKYLLRQHQAHIDDILHAKLLISCLKGLQNVIILNEDFLRNELELLLGISKSYMVYKLTGIDFLVPAKLMPSALSIPEPSPNQSREKKGGKVTRQRKQRPSAKKDVARKSDTFRDHGEINNGYTPATVSLDMSTDDSILRAGNALKTSDSDFSDSDTGKEAKVAMMEGRMRQAALNLLLTICKFTEKRTMFSYWSSFIPDGPPLASSHSLTNCILRDPSPRGRMAALNVLLSLLTSSKMYLSQAEFSDRVGSFTPFSVVLGSVIKGLHHCLCLALNETSYPVLTQALKCMAYLVQATPYHRLSPGLTTKIIRNVKHFIHHKDATVQVAALIVIGCVLASEPTVKETRDAFLKNITREKGNSRKVSPAESDDFDYASFSDDEIACSPMQVADTNTLPWVLQKCMFNLQRNASPAPVQVESLQVISAMSRNYFESLVGPHLKVIGGTLELALTDKFLDVRLHAGRTVDFIGQAMHQYYTNETASDLVEGLPFWHALLNGPLVDLLQCKLNPIIRSVGCDCLGSIGQYSFEQLPRNKQLLCVTLLLSCSRDEDFIVRGSAVRALSISVMYPSLREDPGFVIDTAEAIHRTINEETIGLRIKSSWALGSLSDALVLNNSDPNIFETIPDELLLHIISDSYKGCSDIDKVKSNVVRALGNLLQLIDDRLINEDKFKNAFELALSGLVKCATTGSHMKVRWNSCYAIGNVMKNPCLYKISPILLATVFKSLADLVMAFKNFKVRINAALALASCGKREFYGEHFVPAWNGLVKALENSENMEDFSEYKHRDHLIEQICLSLGHLTTLLTPKDITPLKHTFSESALKSHIQRVYDRLVPEKSTVLFLAHEHLLSFENLSSEQQEVVEALKTAFSNEIAF